MSLFLRNEQFLALGLKVVFIFREHTDENESLPLASFIQCHLTGRFFFYFNKKSVDFFQILIVKN